MVDKRDWNMHGGNVRLTKPPRHGLPNEVAYHLFVHQSTSL